MVLIDNILVSDEIFTEQFVCDLQQCKGGCCVDGDCGAPLTEIEAKQLSEAYPVIKEALTDKAIKVIEEEGTYTPDVEYGPVTPVVDGGICVYGYYNEQGIVQCALEKYYREGKSKVQKPVSCHLFPIRVVEKGEFIALNYEPRPGLCSPACKLGQSLKMPVYKFLKEPIIRRFGQAFFEALEATAQAYFPAS
ncbi:MAG TPA: DUF3109 family protein [Edaphocola sp.]|nr:DUF3109 family protein [Edaphocola sp.]